MILRIVDRMFNSPRLVALTFVASLVGFFPASAQCEDCWSPFCYQSLFSARIDSVWMSPAGESFRSEILDPGSGETVISRDLDLGFPVAPQITLRSFLLDGYTAEFVYLGETEWSSSATFDDVPPTPNLDVAVEAEARFQNFEANWVGDPSVVGTRCIVGLRYLEYDDSLREAYVLDTGLGPVNETALGQAENHMFGPQIGFDLDVSCYDPTLFQFGGKLGFLNNRTRQSGPAYSDALVIDGVPESMFAVDSDEFTLLCEVDALLQRMITSCLVVHIGYQGLYLDNVMQSASQVGSPSEGSSLWIHGLVLGGQWYY